MQVFSTFMEFNKKGDDGLMLPKYQTRDFDLMEVVPPSSPALKESIDSILGSSQNWTAALECLNADDGSYRIILQGRLREPMSLSRSGVRP